MFSRCHDFEARLRFLTTGEGGRQSPVMPGYKGDFRYLDDPPGTAWMIWPYEFMAEGGTLVSPGTAIFGTIYARMYIVVDQYRASEHRRRLSIGTQFQVVEGSHVVAEGIVTKIVGLHED